MHLFEADSSKIIFASKQEFKDKSIKNELQCTFTLNFMSNVYGAVLFRHFRSWLTATRFLHNSFSFSTFCRSQYTALVSPSTKYSQGISSP